MPETKARTATVLAQDSAQKQTEFVTALPVSGLERLLSARTMPFVTVGGFLAMLFFWASMDHSWPVFDAAAHCLDSTAIKSWLCHPKDWSADSFVNLLRLQPTYPAGAWFLSGFFKIFFGESKWSEHVILGVFLIILSATTWSLSYQMQKDRLQANLSVLFVNCSPLILCLQHSTLIDLPHVALYSAFMCALVHWWRALSWSGAVAAGVLLGLYCLTKQIAILFAAPVVVVMGIILLKEKRYRAAGQAVVIALLAGLFLCSWVLPNLAFLLNFVHARSALSSSSGVSLSSIYSAFQEYLWEMVQSFSPLMTVGLAVSAFKLRKSDLSAMWTLLVSALVSVVLVVGAASCNGALSPRFGVPLMVAFSCVLATSASRLVRGTAVARGVSVIAMVLCVVQALAICFQPAPATLWTQNRYPVPLYKALGLTDSLFPMTLPYTAAGDPWKQEWLLEYIENAERGRPVFVNVLVNCTPFNEGTLNVIARSRRSNIRVVTWRSCMSCTADTFSFTEEALHSMQWLVLKTGEEKQYLFDASSRDSVDRLIASLTKEGRFVETIREPLPDGTELVLYQNKEWIRRIPGCGGSLAK